MACEQLIDLTTHPAAASIDQDVSLASEPVAPGDRVHMRPTRRYAARTAVAMTQSCSFCGLPRAEVRALIVGPEALICDQCARRARASIADAMRAGRVGTQPCSFCRVPGRAQYVGYSVRICDECTELCCSIVEEHPPPSPLPTARVVRR